jgi:hypothetical protein
MCRYRNFCLNRVLAPEGGSLSFASPKYMDVLNIENAGAIFCKRKEPMKRRPDAGCYLRSGIFAGIFQKGLLCPSG